MPFFRAKNTLKKHVSLFQKTGYRGPDLLTFEIYFRDTEKGTFFDREISRKYVDVQVYSSTELDAELSSIQKIQPSAYAVLKV